MAYAFSLNNVVSDVHAGLLLMKTLLKANGWTVPQSGDGLAAGPAGDVLTGSGFGVAASANNLGNDRSWFRLVAPDGREFIFQQNGGSSSGLWQVRYSFSAGFVGSADGAPSPTVAPTAVDEVTLFGRFRVGFNLAQQAIGGALGNSAQVWDYCIGGAAEGYAFYALGRRSPAGNYHGGVIFDSLTDTEASDLDPNVYWFPGGEVGGAAANTIFDSARIGEARYMARPKTLNAGLDQGTTTAPWAYQRDPDNEPGVWSVALNQLMLYSSNEIGGSTSVNPYDGNFDVVLGVDWFHGRYTSTIGPLPTGYNPGVARGAYKGRSRLIVGWSGTGLNDMDTDAGLTKVYMSGAAESYWLRWDGATAPVL